MKIFNSLHKYLPLIYVLFVILGFLYVRAVLKNDSIQVSDKVKKEDLIIKPTDVLLVVEQYGVTKTYKTRLRNLDTAYTLLDNIRKNNLDFTFSYLTTIDGTQIDSVNSQVTSENLGWHLIHEDKDITKVMKETYLRDKATYTLRYY